MISDGDNIAVGVSGGKDSMTLLHILNERLKKIPVSYKLFPIYIDPGFENSFKKELEDYCKNNNFNLSIDNTDFGILAHSNENRENPCFLCSRLRRKRLFEIADSLGCKKLALGHHKDDIIETLFLNIFYSGRISTMKPLQTFFEGAFTIIRPLALLEEDTIIDYKNKMGIPEFVNTCPSAEESKRKEIKQLLEKLYKSNGNIKGNIFRAMSRVKTEYLL